MQVIAVVSQKGGSGKTTLTGHLSVQASLSHGGPVAVIDTDPQGSLAAWWNERIAPDPVFVQTNLVDLRAHLDNLRQAGVKTVFVDTPPAITSSILEVIKIADYIVVPTKPSPHDLRAVGATVQLVQSCDKPMVFVLNDASPRAKITFEAAVALSQHGTVAPVTVHHRTLFASSMIDGRTAMELEPSGQSATEILGLWQYLNARLNSEVVPTAIGLDAMNRRDGLSSGKQPFTPAAAPHDVTVTPAEIEALTTPDVAADAYYDEMEPATPPPAAPAMPGPEPVTASLAKPSSRPTASEPGHLDADVPNQDELWEGFAAPEHEPRPALKPSAANHNQNGGQGQLPTFGPGRVFGRRQVM